MSEPGDHLLLHRARPDSMARALQQHQQPAPAPAPSWKTPLAIAAALVLGILIGRSTPSAPEPEPQTASVSALTPVRLVYHVDHGTSVEVAGSWNSWTPEPMHATDEGLFFTVVALPPGRHEYMFVIDGEHWISDPTALLTHDDGFGQQNAVLQIGA